jgi:hypothetical protein
MSTTYYRVLLIAFIILGMWAPAFADSSEDARKHLVRGMAAIESAKNAEELSDAVDEFKKATELDPNMAAAWYNLGSVQSKTGQYKDAIASYERYLTLAPQADDARKIKDEIIKLEFRLEQTEKVKSRAGTWVAEDGTMYRLVLDGNRMTFSTQDYWPTDAEATSSYMGGNLPKNKPTTVKYTLELQRNKINGLWNRAAFPIDKCTIPEDSAEVTGEIRDAEHLLILRYTYTKYKAIIQMSLLTDDFCKEVAAVDKIECEKKFFGPLPKGGLGVALGGIHQYWPGGFSAIKFGWSGHLVVYGITKDSPAFSAGLRNEDEILAIDNVAVATLSASEAIRKLRGEPGTEVELTIMRKKKADAPLTVRMRRIVIPD